MAYSTDRVLQSYLEDFGAGGEIYAQPDMLLNDYFALVNSNIASGKTDAFIAETIVIQSVINLDGAVRNHATITRTHNGKDQKDWWYNKQNKNYFQLFTPLGTTLIAIDGHDGRTHPELRTNTLGTRDEDLVAIEDTAVWLPQFRVEQSLQFGKTVFANYLTTPPGETRSLTFDYELPKKIPLDAERELNYRFIFERQSGSTATFSYRITAPQGFFWQESDSPEFAFVTSNPDRRMILDLTLLQR